MRVAITGALSYTGRYIAAALLDAGHQVVNLSRRSVPIAQAPLTPAQVAALAPQDDLGGCDVLYCTYWTRFVGAHEATARRCGELFEKARRAGVRKIVFASHTRVDVNSEFPYIAGKARACELLRASGVNYAIVRPCGIFGDTAEESILMNNAAWLLRRTPLFLVPGDGRSRFQPIHVRDMADLMMELGQDVDTSGQERDACGPDAPSSLELFVKLRDATGGLARVVAAGLSSRAVTLMTQPLNFLTGDVLLDGDDLDILLNGLTVADDPSDPAIQRRRSLFEWIDDNGDSLGRRYVSSMDRYYRPFQAT